MSDQCPAWYGNNNRPKRCANYRGHDGRHWATDGHKEWTWDDGEVSQPAEPAQTRPTAPVTADTAPAAMTVPGNDTEARSVFPPPTVPRCDGCGYWVHHGGPTGTCRLQHSASPPVSAYGSIFTRPDYYCAAHEPATTPKETA